MRVGGAWAEEGFYLAEGIICMHRVNATQKPNTHTLVLGDG